MLQYIIRMDAIDELLSRGVDTIYPTKDALEKVLRSGKKLKVFQGFDPTGTQLHIGHMAGLRKLRQFQDLGHHVIFLIGDGTGLAGDPSGKLTARDRFLTREELRKNATDYVKQASKVVRFDGDNPVEILFNGDWIVPLATPQWLDLLGRFSLKQLSERDIFDKRIKEGKDVNMREFVYPLLQGYDSVAMKVDLEVGGTDQTFNMLAGRKLVKEILGKEKYVLTLPLLTDAQGRKIGKTEGNVIALTTPPHDLYGMIMNLPDEAIVPAFEYITDVPMEKVNEAYASINNGDNPMTWKKNLACTLTRMLNDNENAKDAEEFFERTFQKKEIATDIAQYPLSADTPADLLDLLVNAGLSQSKSNARRLLRQGAVEIDGKRVDNEQDFTPKEGMVIKVGKHRFIKIKMKK